MTAADEIGMRNLVIVMAGDASVHEQYAVDRDFELWVCHWGADEAVAARYRKSCDRLFRMTGQKWALVREVGRLARRERLPPFSDYDYVFLPDDDIDFPGGAGQVSEAFALAREIGADIFQPAIANENVAAGWSETRCVPGNLCRATSLAEIMMPAYSGAIFASCVLPLLHALIHIEAGWGIEPLIARFGEALRDRPTRTFVLDKIPVVHTRPIGQGPSLHSMGWDEGFLNPLKAGLRMQEFASFKDARDAARFEFPETDQVIDHAAIRKQLRRIHGAREILDMSRARGLASLVLNGLIKVAGRTPRR